MPPPLLLTSSSQVASRSPRVHQHPSNRRRARQLPLGLLHLTDHSEIAEELYQEQVKHFSTTDDTLRQPTYELKSLPVLDFIIREILRMHHRSTASYGADLIVPGTLFAPSKDSQYIVPRGHYVLACPAVSQVDKSLWFKPKEWIPSRWTDPEGQLSRRSNSTLSKMAEKVDYGFGGVSKGTESPYQPFGADRHRCIGE
ncbi:cytochrome P450 [Lactarius pseudohatsudake]|nr:cytochrome P450 [Lactarius pseudohatsudake]